MSTEIWEQNGIYQNYSPGEERGVEIMLQLNQNYQIHIGTVYSPFSSIANL